MPNNREEHINYTRKEWETWPIFKLILYKLNNLNIKTVVDLGANVGEVSNVFFEKISSIENLYLFEPQNDNFNFILDRFQNNSKFKLFKYGIYYGKEQSNLYRQDSNVGGYSVEKNIIEEYETVDLKPLEYFNIKNIDFIKIDIEGAEYNVLQNSTILKEIPYVLVEAHPHGFDLSILNKINLHQYFLNYLTEHLNTHDLIYCDSVQYQYFLEKKK
jgi:FkbM family methyltransferase